MLTTVDKPKPHPDVVSTSLPGGEVVLLQLATKQYYSLNTTGARIWNLIQNERSLGEIGQHLEKDFEVTLEAAHESVTELVQSLVAEKLVLVDEEPS